MPGMTLANCKTRRVVIGASRERIKPESAKQESEHECVTRKLVEMLLGACQCVLGFTLDRCRKNSDVLAFASGCCSCQFTRQRCHGPRFAGFHVAVMDYSSRAVRLREAGV